jgi:uncharacterized delta-60 repeat protein
MKYRLQSRFIVLICCLFAVLPAMAQCGYLDRSFGTNGIAVATVRDSVCEAAAVAVQTDGKVVVAGSSKIGNVDCFTLIRYNSDGGVDRSFGLNGIVAYQVGLANSNITSIVIQPDGKIVVGGISRMTNVSIPKLTLARFTSDGHFDPTFDQDGIVTPANNWAFFGYKIFVALQPDNKIIAAGQTGGGIHAIFRYNTDGSPDSTFDTNGNVITSLQNIDYQLEGMVLQEDGKILTTGSTTTASDAMLRYTSAGGLDATFGSGGLAYLPPQAQSWPAAVAERPGGKIVVAACECYLSQAVYLYGFNSDGSIDSTFALNGLATASPVNSVDITDMRVGPDGRIVLTGFEGLNNHITSFVLCFKSDGTPDDNFDGDGLAIIDAEAASQKSRAVTFAPNGDIVIAGAKAENYVQYMMAARFRYCKVSPEFTTLTVYPNPGDGAPAFQTDNILDNATVTVFNVQGARIMQQSGLNGQWHILHAESLPAGVYYIQLMQDGAVLGCAKYLKVQD